jgi:hypothetical protein
LNGKLVIAWYCPGGNTPDNIAAYRKHVGGKDPCIHKDGYNSCYNKLAVKQHNIHRKAHKAKDLKFDATIAKKVQAYLDKFKGKKLKDSKASDRPSKCGENWAEYAGIKTILTKKKDVVSKYWYDF